MPWSRDGTISIRRVAQRPEPHQKRKRFAWATRAISRPGNQSAASRANGKDLPLSACWLDAGRAPRAGWLASGAAFRGGCTGGRARTPPPDELVALPRAPPSLQT